MKNKNIIIILILFFSGIVQLSAQHDHNQHQHRNFDIVKFKQKKADFIISEAGLSQTESATILPLMNELLEKRFKMNREVRQESRLLRNKENKTEADYERLINMRLDAELKKAQLNKEYYLKFRKVLSAEKIYRCKKAEDKFMKETVYKMRRDRQKEK